MLRFTVKFEKTKNKNILCLGEGPQRGQEGIIYTPSSLFAHITSYKTFVHFQIRTFRIPTLERFIFQFCDQILAAVSPFWNGRLSESILRLHWRTKCVFALPERSFVLSFRFMVRIIALPRSVVFQFELNKIQWCCCYSTSCCYGVWMDENRYPWCQETVHGCFPF